MFEQHADFLIHIDESLENRDLAELQKEISTTDGVYSACISERAKHLMIVEYDPESVTSRDLLGRVASHGLHAEMIGL